jgi:hypothetical protein
MSFYHWLGIEAEQFGEVEDDGWITLWPRVA